jgi:hypothetical protein
MQSWAVADAWHAGSVQTNVWMDSWQMNCCGERFETESKVSWTLRSATGIEWLDVVVGHGTAATIDAIEDHHGGTASEGEPTAATVASIATLHRPSTPAPVPGSRSVVEVRAAEKWTGDRNDRRLNLLGFALMQVRESLRE